MIGNAQDNTLSANILTTGHDQSANDIQEDNAEEGANSHADNPSAGRREYVPIGLSSASMPHSLPTTAALALSARLPVDWCVFQDYHFSNGQQGVVLNSNQVKQSRAGGDRILKQAA